MRISGLIQGLQRVMEKEGDLPVLDIDLDIDNGDWAYRMGEEVVGVEHRVQDWVSWSYNHCANSRIFFERADLWLPNTIKTKHESMKVFVL